MANSFSVTSQYRFGGPAGKSFMLVDGVLTIDTTASGGAAVDDLPASMFKLTKIVACLGIVNDGETKNYYATPDYTGDSLVVGGGSSDAFQDLPNDVYRLRLIGT
jgi:hypothetical protein